MVCNLSQERPNFRIVEGSEDSIDFEELKKDYLNPNICVDDILAKHGITRKKYLRLRRKLVEDTGVPVKPFKVHGKPQIRGIMEHITQDPLSQKYRVAKYFNGILRHYGRYKTLEEAVYVRDLMEENNWDVDFYENSIKPHYFKNRQDEEKDEVYMEFKSDYLNGVPMNVLLKKYGLSKYRYHQLSTSLKHEYGLSRKPLRVRT